MAFDSGQVGPQVAASSDGTNPLFRQGRQQDVIVSELHGRFYEQTFRGNVYSTGMQLTSISNATFTTATGLSGTLGTAATATPIVGFWNPSSVASGFNAVVLQASLGVVVTNATSTGCGGFIWAVFAGNTAGGISVGSQATPVNRKTLLASGSQMKGLSGLALTGLAATGLFLSASSLGGGSAVNFSFVGTAVGDVTIGSQFTENIDGSIIVPPGGVLALFCSTTPVAHSAVSSVTWEEVPV